MNFLHSSSKLSGAYAFKREWRPMGRAGRAWYVRAAVLAACGALYLAMWSSYVYFNAEVVHNGDRIKLRDAVGNFVKSEAVQVRFE